MGLKENRGASPAVVRKKRLCQTSAARRVLGGVLFFCPYEIPHMHRRLHLRCRVFIHSGSGIFSPSMLDRCHHSLSWPKAPGDARLVACPICDTLQTSPRLRQGHGAYCICCGELLYRNRPHSLVRATSYSLGALIFMGVAHTLPFLTMGSGGLSNRLTLIEAAVVLMREQNVLVGCGVFFFTVLAPLILLGGLLYVAGPLLRGRVLPGAVVITRTSQRLEPWSMQEVFLLGLIVSLLKLAHLADLQLGFGLWALAGAVLCTAAALASIDRRELWDRLEIAERLHEAHLRKEAKAAPA